MPIPFAHRRKNNPSFYFGVLQEPALSWLWLVGLSILGHMAGVVRNVIFKQPFQWHSWHAANIRHRIFWQGPA
jgi:hypothetical protein